MNTRLPRIPKISHADVAVTAVNAFKFIFRLLQIKTFLKNLQNIHNYLNTFIEIPLRKIGLLNQIVAPCIAYMPHIHTTPWFSAILGA